MMKHTVNETVTVKVGVLGRVETSLGTATIHQTIEADDAYEMSRKVGELIGDAYRAAYVEAMVEFQPELTNHWRDQGSSDPDTSA